MNEIRLLFRKDIFILINNIKLILRNPLRLLPYGAFLAYIFFIYSQRINSGEDSGSMEDLQNIDTSGLEQVDFGMQNIVGGITLAALAILIFHQNERQLLQNGRREFAFHRPCQACEYSDLLHGPLNFTGIGRQFTFHSLLSRPIGKFI